MYVYITQVLLKIYFYSCEYDKIKIYNCLTSNNSNITVSKQFSFKI